jgi:hypothetical protein
LLRFEKVEAISASRLCPRLELGATSAAGKKAAEHCRTPKRRRNHKLNRSLASWSAALLRRFQLPVCVDTGCTFKTPTPTVLRR